LSCDYISLANIGARNLQPYIPGRSINELAKQIGFSESNVLKLASNENPLGPPKQSLQAIVDTIPNLSFYPESSGHDLKARLSEMYSVGFDSIILGNGSNDLIELAARSYLNENCEVIYSQYAFAIYSLVVASCGAKGVEVAAKEWGHDLDEMANAISENTRLIFIANPNNPTGSMVTNSELIKFLDKVPDHVLVILDEAYGEYVDDKSYPHGVSFLADYSNLIVLRTFSKFYGLAGLRIGYAIADKVIINVLNRIRQPFNVNSLALVAAVAAIDDKEYFYKSRHTNIDGMLQLEAGFAEQGFQWIPSSGNFISFNAGCNALQMYEALLRKGIIVRPLEIYKMPDYLRVTVGTKNDNQRFLQALMEVVLELK